MWRDVGRCGEIWGDVAACRVCTSMVTMARPSLEIGVGVGLGWGLGLGLGLGVRG